jgi:uncharacterized protein YgiM (DUF1202 family)
MNRLRAMSLVLSLSSLALIGCAAELLELGSVEEEALIGRGVAAGAALEEGALAEEAAAASRALARYGFEEARLVRRFGSSYLVNNRGTLAEVVNARTLRLSGYGRVSLPGRLFAVRDEVANVFVRPGQQYQVLTQVTKGRTFLVLRRLNNWMEVSDGTLSGFVMASAMATVIHSSFANEAYVTRTNAMLHSKQSHESSRIAVLPVGEKLTLLLSWRPLASDIAVATTATALTTSDGHQLSLARGEYVYITGRKHRQLLVSYFWEGKERTGVVESAAFEPIKGETWYRTRAHNGLEGWIAGKDLSLSMNGRSK